MSAERTKSFCFEIYAFEFSLVAFPARIVENVIFQFHVARQKSIQIRIAFQEVY